jgi:hypothetical protein
MGTVDQATRVQATERSLLFMMAMAFATGLVAGVGAWGFRLLIGLVHNVLFLGEFTFAYDANLHTPSSPLGPGRGAGSGGRGSGGRVAGRELRSRG